VAKAGLVTAIGEHFKPADRMRLWEFNEGVHCVGDGSGTACKGLVQALRGPDGGTEVGRAIEAAIAAEKTGNIVVVTDGKSWALDPQRLARTGIRLTAVLIGEDALDAGISHLAGMTGGQSFVATSSDAGIAIAAAIEAARAPRVTPQPIEGKPMQVMALRRGARVIATWDEQPSEPTATTAEARQIGATAAMLAIPLMQESEAKALAESEGVVCHLTSLVLVDEAGVRHEGLPAVRKVALSAPAMARMAMPVGMLDRSAAPAAAPAASRSSGRAGVLRRYLTGGTAGGLHGMVTHIDWDNDPDALSRGDLASLPQNLVAAIEVAARLPAVVALANSLGLNAVVVVIALMAKAAGSASRSAQRIARTLLAGADQNAVTAATAEAGL